MDDAKMGQGSDISPTTQLVDNCLPMYFVTWVVALYILLFPTA